MGGSGSSYTPRGGSSSGCADIDFLTVINEPANLTGLKVGDTLSLERNARREVIFRRANGKQVGKLFSGSLLRVVNCMSRGYNYSATIHGIEESVCRVRVFCSRPRK